MDVQERLDELTVLIEDAKSMPLSASCVVNRTQVLDLIDEIRQLLPESVHRADELLADQEGLRQPIRAGLDGVLQLEPPLVAIAQQLLAHKNRGTTRRYLDPRIVKAQAATDILPKVG